MHIGIIGGGASGMMLASMLKGTDNIKITLVERNQKLGKKLLLTGNGKCNFTSGDFDDLDKIYNSDFAREIYRRYTNYDFISFLINIGIEPKVEIHKFNTYYYPRSNKATSVYYALIDRIIANGVSVLYDNLVSDIEIANDKFKVYANDKCFAFDKIVIATGGITYRNTGSDGSIFKILEKFGHKIVKPLPALCGFTYDDKDLKKLKGVRVDAKVVATITKQKNQLKYFAEAGEIQFTENGISGIPIMNISRLLNRDIDEGKNVTLHVDFSSTHSSDLDFEYNEDYIHNRREDVYRLLKSRKEVLYYKKAKDFLCGYVPDEIAEIILKRSNISSDMAIDLDDGELRRISENIVNFTIDGIRIPQIDNAQVTIGGVDTNYVNVETLESKIVKNMYFTGEVLNIDGKCGGYNLQLAYSTAKTVALGVCYE